MKLTSKLAVLFVLLAIVPLTFLSYLSYESHRQTIEQETINRLVSTTILKEAAVNRWVEDAKGSIQELARRPLIRKYAAVLASRSPADSEYRAAHRSIFEDHLEPTIEEEKGFRELFILRGSDGLKLVSSDEKQERRYRESEPYFVEGKNSTCVQNVYYSLPLGKAVMTISTPIKDKDGNLIAVLAGHVDLAEMSEIMMQRSGLSATEKTYVVNKFNFFVTDPGLEPGYALKKAVYTDGVKAGLERQNGVGLYNDHRGVPVIGAYRWMPERELVILAEVDQVEAFAPILALRKVRLGIGAAVAAIVALLGLFFARTITRPVLQLVKGAEEVGRGNLEYRIELRARDEIGRLAAGFNEMAADLRRSLGALRESEAKYRNLTESLDELIYRADPETFVTTYVNRAVEKIYGYTVEEFLGDPTLWESAIHPEDKERILAELTEAQRKVEPFAIEYRIIRKDKTVRWVEDHASWEKDQQGNAVSMNGVMYDITERKQAEEKTKQLQEYLQVQIERMPIGLIVWDTEFRVTSWNPAAEKIFGFTAQEALGKHPYGLIVPKEAQPHVDDIWRRLLEGDTTAHSINDNMTKDGRTIICQWSNTPLRNADGAVRGVLSMIQDITERKRAEEALARRVTELNALNAMAAIVNESLDLDEMLNRAMDVALRLVGVEAAGMLLLDEAAGELTLVAHRGLSDEFVRAFRRLKLGEGLAGKAAQTGKPVILERLEDYPQARKAYVEQERIQSAASVPLIGSRGVIGAMSLAATSPRYFDAAGLELLVALGQQMAIGVEKARLYEREKEAVAAAAAAKSATDTIEAMGDGLIIHTLNGKITLVNPAFEKMTGYEKDELVGRDVADLLQELVKPEDLEKTMEAIGTALEGKVPIPTSRTLVSKNGREVPITFTVSFIRDTKGQPSAVIVAFNDITALKRTEESLKLLTRELTRSNAELEQFAYVASHDLQEPLRIITSYLQLLERRYKESLDSEGEKFIARAVDSSARMRTLINDLLAYSRVGTQGKPFESTNCESIIGDALANLKVTIKESGAVVTSDPLPTVWADPMQLTQLFQNLLGNAIKFRGADPPRIHISAKPIAESKEEFITNQPQLNRLRIQPGRQSSIVNPWPRPGLPGSSNGMIELEEQQKQENIQIKSRQGGHQLSIQNGWLFSVSDNGIGIEPEYANRIFGIFQRLHTRSEYPGTGIGLAICQKVVQQHGGEIWVDSEPGKGSTFYFIIPDKGGFQE